MFYTNKDRSGVGARHLGNDNAHKANKQTFPNKQIPTRVANDTKTNTISVTARRGDGSKIECADQRRSVVLEDGSRERVTVAKDKTHFDGNAVPAGRQLGQTTGHTARIRKRASGSRLRSNCDENSGLCQVLAPSNIDRSKKVRDYIGCSSVESRLVYPRHRGDYDRATTIQRKSSLGLHREGKSVLCNITLSGNLQQSSKGSKVETGIHRRSCHPLERSAIKPLHKSDVNILLNGNTQNSNGSRCLSKNGLLERRKRCIISGIENGKCVSPVVEKRSCPGVRRYSDESSCNKKGGSCEKKMEKVFAKHSSNLACGMECVETNGKKTKRGLKASKIAVLSKSSGQRKSIISQRHEGRVSDTGNKSSRSDCRVVSGITSDSASLPGNLLEAEITDLDRNGTDCKASRRREIGDWERCASRAGNITGLSHGKVFHSLQVPTSGGGVVGVDEDTFTDTLGGNTAGGQTTLGADDNIAQHATRAVSVQLSRKICQRSQDSNVIGRDNRNARRKRENVDCGVVRQDCVSGTVKTKGDHGMITVLDSSLCAQAKDNCDRTLNNGESTIYDSSSELPQTNTIVPGNVSLADRIPNLECSHSDNEIEKVCNEERRISLSGNTSFNGSTCLGSNGRHDDANTSTDRFRVCEITEKTSRNDVKATRRQKQASSIPSYQGPHRHGKAANQKNKKLLKRGKDFTNGRTGSDEIRCGESGVKSGRYDSQVPSISASECNTGSKSLNHKPESGETFENETKTLSAYEYKHTDSKIPEKAELLLISDHVSYLVSIPEPNTCRQTDEHTATADDVICKSYAPENLAGTDAGKKSLEASRKGIPPGSVSLGDKERKGVSGTSELSLGLSNAQVKYHALTEECSTDVNNREDCKNVNFCQSDENVTNCDFNLGTNVSAENVRNYGDISPSVDYYSGITNDNAHIVCDSNGGGGYARCVTDQSALKCAADQSSVMATKSSGPLREKNMIPSKHKGERLKRQIGQASLEINLAEKGERGAGALLVDSMSGRRKHESTSTSRLMRPTISSAIRSSPEMAKKLIPKVRSPTSPDAMFSPPLERKNRERKKKENSGKVKSQVVSGDTIAHKPPLDKTTCDKLSKSPRSSVSSTDASVRSGILENVSEITDPLGYQTGRTCANKTKTGSVAPRMHQSASADSSDGRSKRCGTVKVGELSESAGQGVLIGRKQSGKGTEKKDNNGSAGVNSISETDESQVDKLEKVEHRDVKIEKTRRNVETYESGVDSAMDTNRSSSERECRNNQKIDRSISSSPVSNDNSHQDSDAKNGKTKVTRNVQGLKKGEPSLKTNPSDPKLVGKKSVSGSTKTGRGQKPGVNASAVKKKDSSSIMSETETVEKESISDSVQRGGSISPTSSVTSMSSKSVQSNTKVTKTLTNNSKNLKIERMPSRMALNGPGQKKSIENKSVSSKPSVSEDSLKKDKTSTLKKCPSTTGLKKADGQRRKTGLKQNISSVGQAPNTQHSQSERSVSNSPRSSVVDDDTDSAQSSAVAKTKKPESKLPKASKLPSASITKSKISSKMDKASTDRFVRSGQPARQNSRGTLNKSGPVEARNTENNSSESKNLHSKDAICDVKNDSKPASKRKNLKENINRKQREMSPMYHAQDTDCSEFSAAEEVIPSISDYDTDKMEDTEGKSREPSETKDTTFPKTDQSTAESKKTRNAPKSLTSPKVETKKIHQKKSYSKKISPSSPSLNSKTSPGSPKTEVKKSPTSPSSVKTGSSGSPRSPRGESKITKGADSKLPKKYAPKKPQRNLPNLSSLSTLEQRYTAEKLELMRLKIPAEMDFSDVSRPSTREGSVDSRFDDDRWSICSDISSISRASSVSMSSGMRSRGSKVPTRMTVPSSRVTAPASRLASRDSATRLQPTLRNSKAVSSLAKSPTENKAMKGKEHGIKKSNVPTTRKTGSGSKKNSPEEEKSLLKDDSAEKNKQDSNSVITASLSGKPGLDNDNISRSSMCSEWLKGSAPLMRGNEVDSGTLNTFGQPSNVVVISNEQGSDELFPVQVNATLIEQREKTSSSEDKNNLALLRSRALTACSSGREIVSDSAQPADSIQDGASKDRTVNTTADITKHKLHSQRETDTCYNAEAMEEGQYGALSTTTKVIITAVANEGQEGDIPATNQIINSGNVTNLISEPSASNLSDEKVRTERDSAGNTLSDTRDPCYNDKLYEVTGEGGNLSSEADGQAKHEELPDCTVASALYTPSLPLHEQCTLSPHGGSGSAERGSPDNTHRHSVGSDHTNNKHLHPREGGAHEEIPHPTELTPTPNYTGWSSDHTMMSEMEKSDMINVQEDRGGFIGECDGMLSKLSQVKEIKTEGRVDTPTGMPMAEAMMGEAGLSLTEEFMGCDKNGEDFERQFDKNDKISINKPVHISGVLDKPERGGCATKTAGSGFHVAYESSRAQENFDTFEPETETGFADATQGRYGMMISGDIRPGSSHRLEKVQGLGAAHRSSFNSGDLHGSTEGQNSGDIAADARQLEQTALQRGGCQLLDASDEDGINYVSSDEGKPGFTYKSSPDLDISSDVSCETREGVMDSPDMTDVKLQGETDRHIKPGHYTSVSHPDKATCSHAISHDKTKLTTSLVEESHAAYQQTSEKSSIVVLSPGAQGSSEVMCSSDQSRTVLATGRLQKTAGIQIHVNYNGVGSGPVCRDGNSADKGPGKKCDSQTLGRIQSGRSDKLSTPPPESRLIIDKRNLHPDGYDENMPVQRKILLNADSLRSREPVHASKLAMKDASESGDSRIHTATVQSQKSVSQTSKVVMKDGKMSGLSENGSNQSSNLKLKVTVSKFESQKDGASKPTTRLQTYKPVHKSEFLKQSSVRKSLASRAQQKAISARFSQDSSSIKVNKAKESGSVLMKQQSESEKTPRKEHTQSPLPHVSSIKFSLKKDSPDNQTLSAPVPAELVTSSSDGESSSEISVHKCETDIRTSRSDEITVTSYVTSTDCDSLESGSETTIQGSGTQERWEKGENGEKRVESGEISDNDVERKHESGVTNSANSLMADDNDCVADGSLPLNTLQADAISDKAAVTSKPDTDFSIKEDENVHMGDNYYSAMELPKTGKSNKIPPTVLPKPKVSVSADGRIDLSYAESAPLNKLPDKSDTNYAVSVQKTEKILDTENSVASSSEMGFEPQTDSSGISDTNMCEVQSPFQTDVSAISEGSTIDEPRNDVDFVPISQHSDSTVNNFETECTTIPMQTVLTSLPPPEEESIDVCSFDKSFEVSSPRRPSETVSKQALKRSVGTTSLQRWQTVKNKFLGKPTTKVSKEKVNVVPSAHGSVEKTIEEFEVVSDKKSSTKDKSDDKFVDSSRVSEIRRSLSERLAKSPVPDTPPATPSPSPTRKYKWIRGEGGIWKKKFLSDSGESESEVEDYGRENRDECLANLLPVNRPDRNIDRESSSESEYKPPKEGGRHLLRDTGVDNEMETSASEVEDVDVNDQWIKMDTPVKNKDNLSQQGQELTNETDGVCVEKVDFEAIMQHFNNKVASSATDGEKDGCNSVERKSEPKMEESVNEANHIAKNFSVADEENYHKFANSDRNSVQVVGSVDSHSEKHDIALSDVTEDTCQVLGQVTMETDLNLTERPCLQDDNLYENLTTNSHMTEDYELCRRENMHLMTPLQDDGSVIYEKTISDQQNQQRHSSHPSRRETSLEKEIGDSYSDADGHIADGQTEGDLGTTNCVNREQWSRRQPKVNKNISRGRGSYDNIGTRTVCDDSVDTESSRSFDITSSNVRNNFNQQDPFIPLKCNLGNLDSGISSQTELLHGQIITTSENSSDGEHCIESAGVEQTSKTGPNVDMNVDKFSPSVCNKTTDGPPIAYNIDRETEAYREFISQTENQKHIDKTDSHTTQTPTISHSQSCGSINLDHEKTEHEVDRNAIMSEIQEKFIPIEASPILEKKFVASNFPFESEDRISLSAAESLENVSVSPACVSRTSSVTDRGLLNLEPDFSDRGDTESELSSYCGYETTDTTICDDDLDTTVTDDDADDFCELVINEDLDDTVVGAEGGDAGVDLHVPDAYSRPINVDPHRQSDMAYSSCRRYSYAGSTARSSGTASGSSSTEVSDSGYWSTRKAFWEKDSHELLAEISELEESFETIDGTDSEVQRSASASPVKVSEHQGGTTPRRLRRKKSGRRSLSLPSGTLSYGDVKITYVDGHFVAEPPDGPEDTRPKSYDRSNRDSVSSGGLQATSSESIADSNEDTLSIVSDLALREELLSWLNQHLVDSDVFYSQSLDWNCNHVGSDSSTHSSQSSLAMIPASSTLPRRTGRDNDGNRPVSVDEIQLFRNAYFQEQFESKLNSEGQGHSQNYRDQVTQDSLLSDPRNGRRRLSVQDDKSERSRSKSPNFFQRMLSKRKSFSEKVAKVPQEDGAPRKDTSIVRRMSLKSLFKRKTRKGSDEPDSPPIAAFLQDEDIGAVSSLPNSPFVSKRVHRVQTDPQIQIRRTIQKCDDQASVTATPLHQSVSAPRVGLTRPDVPPRRRQSSSGSMKQSSATDRSSGEYSICDYDMGSEDVLTPRSASPSVVDTERDGKQGSGKLVRGEITSNSNDSGIQHDAVLLSSCESLKVSPDSSAPVSIAVKLRKTPSPKQERPKSDITVRWADLLEQVRETDVTYRKDGQTLRKRPRPKSDLEDIMFVDEGVDDDIDDDVDVIVAGGSTLTENMRAYGSIGNLRPSDSLRSLKFVDGFQVELRRSSQDVRVLSAKVVKSRRMSTPHPIKNRADKISSQPRRKAPVMVRSHSMPENLDKLHRKKNFLSLIGSDNQSLYSQRSGGDDSSDESEYSVEFTLHDKCPSTRSSQNALATLDETQEEETMTYAEALWDHVTMDQDELGFRAGDQIRVTDMADKDWWFGYTEQRKGWFPAAFVRLWVNQERFNEDMIIQDTQTPTIRTHGLSPDQGRANVVNEIINAEREYVKHLRDVVEGYLKQAKKRPEMFPAEKISIIFGNIEEIYTFANRFLSSLEKAFNTDSPHMSTIGQVFLLHSQSFEIYSDYCNNHPGSGEEVKELYRNKKYRHFFEACRLLQEMIEIPLEGFLLTPVQKICKYHLQLNELLKYTPPDHMDYSHARAALDSMKKIATLINERKRKMESIEKIATWQASVDDWEGDDILQQSSELIYSGELHKINSSGWSQERYFFLFDHQLVYCKKDLLKKNGFCYKGRIDLDHSEVIPVNDGKDAQYNVTVRHSWKVHDTMRDKWYLLVAKSEQVKQRWLRAFEDERKRVKDDQENNFNIPVHLKEKAITNLKQKTHMGKPKAKRKAARSTSLRHAKKPDSAYPVLTLPRKKQQDSLGDINQSKKLTWFFLGQGKKK